MFRLLVSFWPALLPLALYLAWLMFARRKAKRRGDEVLPGITDGPWVWTTLATLGLVVILFLSLGLFASTTGDYQPPVYKNGSITPGAL